MSIKIVFMGTPDFAVPCLDALINAKYNVVGVFSQPDRPQGRGYKLTPPEVKKLAMVHNIPVYQPTNLKDGEVLSVLKELSPDLIVVVAYGRILPKEILELPPLGCINVHGSLLPKFRGAAPIQWSILNGDKTTGITTMYMGEGLDTGDIILKKETPIRENETAGELFGRLAPLGAELLLETIPLLIAGNAPRIAQDERLATYAPMINKEMGKIDFKKSATEISNWVRGLSPWPGAYTFFNGLRLAIREVKVVEGESVSVGEIVDNKELIVSCGKDLLRLVTVQPQGKNAMSGTAFANGKHIEVAQTFDL